MSTRLESGAAEQSPSLSPESGDKPTLTSWTNGRPWTVVEIEDLRERASTQTIPTIAKHIGRSEMAVRHKLRRLRVDFQDLAGFKAKDLAGMLQVTVRQIRRWRIKGYFHSVNGRITEESFARFCREHAEKIPYDQLDAATRLWLRSYGYIRDCAQERVNRACGA